MKKNLKKLLIDPLIGFPIGILILMGEYLLVYLISGNDVFVKEIASLQNIKTFSLQLLSLGFLYYLILADVKLTKFINKRVEQKEHKNKTSEIYANILVMITVTFISFVICTNEIIFTKNLVTLNLVTWLVFLMSYMIITLIIDFIKNKKQQNKN